MKDQIGRHYGGPCRTEIDVVEHPGGEVEVLQNIWDDSRQVTQEMPSTEGLSSKEEVRRALHESMTEMAILERMGFEFETCTDDIVIWSKDLSTSGENNDV